MLWNHEDPQLEVEPEEVHLRRVDWEVSHIYDDLQGNRAETREGKGGGWDASTKDS